MSFCKAEQLSTNDKRKIRKKTMKYLRWWNNWLQENWDGRFYIDVRNIDYYHFNNGETNMFFSFVLIDRETEKTTPIYMTNFWSMEIKVPTIINRAIIQDLNIYGIYKEEKV